MDGKKTSHIQQKQGFSQNNQYRYEIIGVNKRRPNKKKSEFSVFWKKLHLAKKWVLKIPLSDNKSKQETCTIQINCNLRQLSTNNLNAHIFFFEFLQKLHFDTISLVNLLILKIHKYLFKIIPKEHLINNN